MSTPVADVENVDICANCHIVLQGVVGSTAYGLDTEHSDIDQVGIYTAKIDDVLGLHRNKDVERSVASNNPDITLHEAAPFIRLALVSNSTASELLWLNDYETRTPAGDLLVAHRRRFLSAKGLRGAYGHYARSQTHDVERLVEAGRLDKAAKAGRHAFRIIFQAEHALDHGEIIIDMTDRRDELFSYGELAATRPHEFRRQFDTRVTALATRPSDLPDETDYEAANQLLIAIRKTTI